MSTLPTQQAHSIASPNPQTSSRRRSQSGALLVVFTLAILLLTGLPGFSQQTYVSRYELYGGYAFLDSPHVSLFENGFQLQAGARMRAWLTLGFDYSRSTGSLTLVPSLLPVPLQLKLGAQLAQLAAAGLIPPGYVLSVPTGSVSQTFAAGPSFTYRHFKNVTLHIRPSLGAIREVATPRPGDPIATAIVKGLAPNGAKTDWTGFYGFGGGIDLGVSKHVGIRIQGDFVYDHLFNDILRDGRFTTRFSVGPIFNFGRNIVK
jgi:hypothetical protein